MYYFKKATKTLPTVLMDSTTKSALIKGKSICDDWLSYHQLLEDIKSNLEHETYSDFNFQFDFFNTKSAKFILEILRALKKSNSSISVHWLHKSRDSEMYEIGNDYGDLMDMNISLSSY